MIDKVTEVNMLLDFYGKLLSEKQQKSIRMYYIYDYSLNEIAEELSISKQAVSDNIKRAEQNLEFYESNLNLFRNFENKNNKLKELEILFDNLKENSKDIDKVTLDKIYTIVFGKEEVY